MDPRLEEKFSKENIVFSHKLLDAEIFFTTCEHLIAQNGSILVCSNQLKESKLSELPENVIVFAYYQSISRKYWGRLKGDQKEIQKRHPGEYHYPKAF